MSDASLRAAAPSFCLGCVILAAGSLMAGEHESRTYQVGKKVSGFPAREDLSTPESAYAAIHRAVAAQGYAAFDRLSVPRIVWASLGVRPPALPETYRKALLEAEVVEVRLWDRTHAVVIARIPLPGPGKRFDLRSLERVGERWLNAGHERVDSIEQAHEEAKRLSKAIGGDRGK